MSVHRQLLICGLLASILLGGRAAYSSSTPTGTFLDRPPTDLRVVTFNVLWDSIFSRVNETRAAGFARLAAAIAPDVGRFRNSQAMAAPRLS